MIHSTAEVYTENIGERTLIWQYVIILKGAVIGNECNINCLVFIENDVILGDRITIKSGTQIWDGLRIEDDVFIGPNVTFTNDLFPRSKKYPEEFKKTFIRKGASIGANATILAGLEIGSFSMIGAGSVLTKSTKPYTLWYGNPAIQKGFITETGEIIGLNLVSKVTGEKYYYKNDQLFKEQ